MPASRPPPPLRCRRLPGDTVAVRATCASVRRTRHLLRRLDEPERACDDRLDHGPSLVVEQVHLVDDEQPDALHQRVGALA
eukprot:5455650-Pleurochrysis_carterae.AAC.1